MKQLYDIYKEGWWVKVSPLARKEPECWVCSIYKKGKLYWVTEQCKDFDTPQEAYEWTLNIINAKITAELYK